MSAELVEVYETVVEESEVFEVGEIPKRTPCQREPDPSPGFALGVLNGQSKSVVRSSTQGEQGEESEVRPAIEEQAAGQEHQILRRSRDSLHRPIQNEDDSEEDDELR